MNSLVSKSGIKTLLWLILIASVTFLVYIQLFNNDFLKTWDDNRYILENPHIKDFQLNQLPEIFTLYYDGHYHPLTMISLALDQKVDGMNPKVFHFTNLLLHIINTLLVFWFVFILLKKKNTFVPFFTSLLFGIATIHVESVAWATERKNLLYTLFFLASLIFYLRYLLHGKKTFYVLALIMFVFSLFSKVTAVSLSVSLLAIDYFYNRPFTSVRVWVEKIPFLLLSLLFGIIAVWAQKSSWGTDLSQEHHAFFERVLYASYAFVAYVGKTIIPYKLSGFYPYPGNAGSIILIIGGISLIPIAGIIWYLFKRFKKPDSFIFAMWFFILNIFLLLKLFEVPAGDYILADRYVYVASIGIFLLLGLLLDQWRKKKGIHLYLVSGIVTLYILSISFQTLNRVSVWQNDEKFYTDVIEKYDNAKVAYTNRGSIYRERGKINEALSDFNQAIRIGPATYKDYSNRGVINTDLGNYSKAIEDFRRSISLNAGNLDVLSSYAYACLQVGDFSKSVEIYTRVIEARPSDYEALTNQGTAFYSMNQLNEAIRANHKTTHSEDTLELSC